MAFGKVFGAMWYVEMYCVAPFGVVHGGYAMHIGFDTLSTPNFQPYRNTDKRNKHEKFARIA